MPKIEIDLSDEDFQSLANNKMVLKPDHRWEPDRFTVLHGSDRFEPRPGWKALYSYSSRADLYLARAYLQAAGELFEVCYDMYEQRPDGSFIEDPFVILTNHPWL